jgi:hypothetical protein
MHLDTVYESYSRLIGLIPDIEKRIEELETDLERTKGVAGKLPADLKDIIEGKIKAWKKVLKYLKNLKKRPKAMKLYYAKRVISQIRKLRKKYPDE